MTLRLKVPQQAAAPAAAPCACLPPHHLLQLRRSGPGGAFLLFTTRQHQLHTVSLACLVDGSATGLLAGGAAAAGQPAAPQAQPQQAAQGFRAAMKAAMRPTGAAAAAAAAGGVNVRSVEQNALLVAVPPGRLGGVVWIGMCLPTHLLPPR